MSDTQKNILYNKLYKILDFITDCVYIYLFTLAYLTCCTIVVFIHTPTFYFMLYLLMYILLVYFIIMLVCFVFRHIFLWKLASKLFYGDFKTYVKDCSKFKNYIYYWLSDDYYKSIYKSTYEKVIKVTGRPV